VIHSASGVSVNTVQGLLSGDSRRLYDPHSPMGDGHVVALSNGNWLLWAKEAKDQPLHKVLQATLKQNRKKHPELCLTEAWSLLNGELHKRVPQLTSSCILPYANMYCEADLESYQVRRCGSKCAIRLQVRNGGAALHWDARGQFIGSKHVTGLDDICARTYLDAGYGVAFMKMGLSIMLKAGGDALATMLLARKVGVEYQPCGCVAAMRGD